ncbi:hypothetical protein [Chelativorans sp. AA-79]|uniref:hypothetical protein n=1 Tax=Chelativorans sp. AA-79 TaxID=3028735 RepID=UPI0023F9DABA|nr:hypothetical protein [Chelativorans sp. AA-79]WEX11678.1 hypothetical protein PVE73_12500 [Chelativorans sp. AA-79]
MSIAENTIASIGSNAPVVPFYHFGRHDRIRIGNTAYMYDRDSSSGHVFRRHDNPELVEHFSHELVYRKIADGELAVDRNWFRGSDAHVRAEHRALPVTDLSEKAQDTILWRHSLIHDFFHLEAKGRYSRSDESLAEYMRARQTELDDAEACAKGRKPRGGTKEVRRTAVSPRTFRRWLKRYEQAGFDARSLRDGYRYPGTRPSRFTAEETEIHRKWAAGYASSNQPSKATLFSDMNAELVLLNKERALKGLKPLRSPSRRTFETMIDKLDHFFVLAGRKGTDYATRKLQITQSGVDVDRPLQRVEMDEYEVELMTILMDIGIWNTLSEKEKEAVKPARVWLSLTIDVATRCILAMRFIDKPPSAESSIATLEMAVHDKQYIADAVGAQTPWEMHGTPESVYTDAGAAYVANSFKATVLALTGNAVIPPSGKPHLRGTVERMFLTIRQRFLAWYTGQTFANVVVRGDYDSEGNASISVEELNRLLVRAIVDAYHNTPHTGLAGETPRNAWLRMTKRNPVTPPPAPFQRRSIFGVHCECRIGSKGVRFLGIHYQSPLLQKIRASKANPSIHIRVNRFDLGEISFWHEELGGWAVALPRLEGFQGVSVWEWIAAVQHLSRIHADNARVSQAVVAEAISECRAYGEMAAQRAELGSPVMNREYLREVDRTVFRTFEIMEDGEVHAPAGGEIITLPEGRREDRPADDLNPDNDHVRATPAMLEPQPSPYAMDVEPYADDDDGSDEAGRTDDWSFDH